MKTLIIAQHRAFYGIIRHSLPSAAAPCYWLDKGERTPYADMADVFRGDPGDLDTYASFDPAEEVAAIVTFETKTEAERVGRTLVKALPNASVLFFCTDDERLPELGDSTHVRIRRWDEAIGGSLAGEVRTLFTVQRVSAVRAVAGGASRMAILLQHDPDPDAIASGLCLRNLVGRNRSSCPLVTFGGVTRPENREMLRVLDLAVETIDPGALDAYDVVACVDVQPPYFGPLLTRDVAIVIDHHPEQTGYRTLYRDVRPSCGATSTILTEYLRAADVAINQKQATALLYGVKTDTLFLDRDATEADMEAFRYLYSRANLSALRRIEKPAIPLESLKTFGDALQHLSVESGLTFAFLGEAREDVIPQIAELLLQVEGAEWSVAVGIAGGNVVASIRNAGYQRSAGDVARRVFGELGSAGGHRAMAKAVVPLERWQATLGPADERSIRTFFYTKFLAETLPIATLIGT